MIKTFFASAAMAAGLALSAGPSALAAAPTDMSKSLVPGYPDVVAEYL